MFSGIFMFKLISGAEVTVADEFVPSGFLS